MGSVGDIATIGIVAGIGYLVWQNWDSISSGFNRIKGETEQPGEKIPTTTTPTTTPTTTTSTKPLSHTINKMSEIAASDSPAAPVAKKQLEQLLAFQSTLKKIPAFGDFF